MLDFKKHKNLKLNFELILKILKAIMIDYIVKDPPPHANFRTENYIPSFSVWINKIGESILFTPM